jgi:hypothetical protein
MFQYTGEYIKAKTIYGSEFYTFTPATLCNSLSIDVDNELLALLTTAHKLLGVLEGMTTFLPNLDSLHRLMRLKECCHSLRIDYKDSLTFRDALKKASSGQEDLGIVANLVAAHQYAYDKNVGHPVLAEVYGIILSESKSTHKADVRKTAIPLENYITNMKTYSPTAPEHIMPALYDMVKFLNMDNHIDVLMKAALAHYQFEMIHPFDRYNGLIGRIMIQMILQNAHYKAASYMCLSEYLELHKEAYFNKLSATQMGSGFIPWIKFFVKGICVSADRAIIRIRRFAETISEDEEKITALALPSKYINSVYNHFRHYLISEIIPVSLRLNISYNTAAKVVKSLADAKILTLEQKQSRHKVYCHRSLDVLELQDLLGKYEPIIKLP